MPRNRKGLDISGVLLLDKSSGITSNKALQQVKRLFNAKKAGHTGSLDPLATGILPICFGEATKFAKYLLADSKTYIATAKLGKTTNTLDIDGEIIKNFQYQHVTEELLKKTLKSFLGISQQIPPMFSALKVDGVPLHKIARRGEEIKRKSRTIEIFAIELLSFSDDEFVIKVKSSKGTYIRSLVADIATKMQTGAYIKELRRVGFANFDIQDCYSFNDLSQNNFAENEAKLIEIDAILPQFAKLSLGIDEYKLISHGRQINCNYNNELVKMFFQGKFIGIAEAQDNILQPKRLVNY